MEAMKYSPNWYWGKAGCQIVRLPTEKYKPTAWGSFYQVRLILDGNNKFVCFNAGFNKEIVLAIKIIRENKVLDIIVTL